MITATRRGLEEFAKLGPLEERFVRLLQEEEAVQIIEQPEEMRQNGDP